MSQFAVDYGQLSMAGALLERQAGHTEAMRSYVESHCRLQQSDFGLLLQLLYPLNEFAVSTADQVLKQLGSFSSWSADTMSRTLDTYVESDREAYENARELMARLGDSLPPFDDPRGNLPRLGGPGSSAPSDYGQEPSHWHPTIDTLVTAGGVADSGVDLVTGTVDRTLDRLGSLGNRGGVVERTDPTSYLVPPDLRENFVEELRWKAGLVLGSVDWVAEQFLGVSILEEYVFKPFGGDWHAMQGSAQAWSHTDRALTEMGSNFSGLPGQVDTWTGDSSLAFLGAMTALSGVTVGTSYAFGFASGLMDKVALVAKLACTAIATILRKISDKLLRIAAEAAVPVIGWIVGAVEVVILIGDAIALTGMIKSLIETILDAIADFIAAREKLVQVLFMVEDLVSAAVTRAVR